MFSVLFLCDFQMGWYPFDIQKCTLDIGMDRDAQFVEFLANNISFTGKELSFKTHSNISLLNRQLLLILGKDLPMYLVQSVEFSNKQLNNVDGVQISIGRIK